MRDFRTFYDSLFYLQGFLRPVTVNEDKKKCATQEDLTADHLVVKLCSPSDSHRKLVYDVCSLKTQI